MSHRRQLHVQGIHLVEVQVGQRVLSPPHHPRSGRVHDVAEPHVEAVAPAETGSGDWVVFVLILLLSSVGRRCRRWWSVNQFLKGGVDGGLRGAAPGCCC